MSEPEHTPPACIFLAGASGGLGSALCRELAGRFPDAILLTLSRSEVQPVAASQCRLQIDLSDPQLVQPVAKWLQSQPLPNRVIQCCGTLHWDGHLPEKNLAQCSDEALLHSMSVNLLSHLHLASALAPLLQRRSPLS